MSKVKIGREIEMLGEELAVKCPNNECRIFRDAYIAYKNMASDRMQLMGYVSQATMAAIERQIVKTVAKLYDMYHHNDVIRAFVRKNQAKLTERVLS